MAAWQNDPVVSSGSSWRDDPVVKNADSPKISKTEAGSMLKAGMAGGRATPEAKVVRKNDEIRRIALERVAAYDKYNPERLIANAVTGDKVSNKGGQITGEEQDPGFLRRAVDTIKNVPTEAASFMDAARGSFLGTFGLGTRAVSGAESLITGRPYKESLAINQRAADILRERSLAGDVVGSVAPGMGVIGAGGKVLQGFAKVAPKAANIINKAVTLEKGATISPAGELVTTAGQKLRNVGRIVAGGAIGGGVQAEAEGKDAKTGAITGAIAAPVVMAGLRLGSDLVRKVGRKYANNVNKALQESVFENPEVIADRQRELSALTKQNVPVIAALNDGDFNRVVDNTLKISEPANEIAKTETSAQIGNFKERMVAHVKQAGQTAQRSFDRTIRDRDMKPVVLGKDGRPLMLPASGSIAELTRQRNDTVEQMIDPIRNNPVELTGLKVPEAQRRSILSATRGDPALEAPFRKALGSNSSPATATVGELDALRQRLRSLAKTEKNGNQARIYADAHKSVRKLIEDAHPQYKPAMDVYAANSKMLKGFKTAAAGKRLSDVDKPDIMDDINSREGRVGMMLGELYRQRKAVGDSPSSAVRAAEEYAARGKLTRPADIADPEAIQPGSVTENMSGTSAEDLAKASEAQLRVLDRMAKAGGINVTKEDKALDVPSMLSYSAALATGPTFATTKASFFNHLLHGFPTRINDKVAKNMTEMLFSGDEEMTRQAMQALRKIGITDQVLRSWIVPVTSGAAAASGGPVPNPGSGVGDPNATPTMIDVGSGTEIPNPDYNPGPQSSFEDLAGKVEMAESAGNQDAVSSAGAIGVMQVMPDTAPEAAQLAGLPFDERKYRTDPEYNRQIGRAYLKAMLDQFGDEELALVAYNWGPTNLQKTLDAGKDWRTVAPQETRDYVDRILTG